MIKHYFENIAFQRFVLEKVCFVTAASSQNNPYRAICAFHCQDRFIEVAVDDSDNASTGAAASSAPAAVPAHGHGSSRRRGQVIKLFFVFCSVRPKPLKRFCFAVHACVAMPTPFACKVMTDTVVPKMNRQGRVAGEAPLIPATVTIVNGDAIDVVRASVWKS